MTDQEVVGCLIEAEVKANPRLKELGTNVGKLMNKINHVQAASALRASWGNKRKMKLTTKQRNELRVLKWWKPSNVKFKRITDKQVADYFAWSDRGVAHGRSIMGLHAGIGDGFAALYWAKNRRDLQITSYLEDWGEYMNAWSFTGMPRYIVEDIAKRMKKPGILEVMYAGRKTYDT